MNEVEKKKVDLHIKVRHTPKTVALSYVVENIGINIRVGVPIKQKDEYKVPIYLPLSNGEKVTCGIITIDKNLKVKSAPDINEVEEILQEALKRRFSHTLHTFAINHSEIYTGTRSGEVVIIFKRIYGIAFDDIMKIAETYYYWISEIEAINSFVCIHFTPSNNIVEDEDE